MTIPIDQKYKLLKCFFGYFTVSAVTYLFFIVLSLFLFQGYMVERTEMVFLKNGKPNEVVTDSVVRTLYRDGRLDDFYEKANAYNKVSVLENNTSNTDSVSIIKSRIFELMDLDLVDFIRRYRMLNSELEPLGFKGYIRGCYTLFDKEETTAFSYPNIIWRWLVAWFPLRAIYNPLYILVFNGLIVIVISRCVRKFLCQTLQQLSTRLLSRFNPTNYDLK